MSWIRRKFSQVTSSPNHNVAQSPQHQDPNIVRYDVFKSHWHQVAEIISKPHLPVVKTNHTIVNQISPITQDDVDAVRNLLEQMIYLLVEEQTCGMQLGPILEYVVTEKVLDQLFKWCDGSGEYKQEISMNLIKIYEVLISRAQHSLLHHRQLVNPMLKLLSSCSNTGSEEVDSHIVLLLNLLCVWINRDPTLLDIFFRLADEQGPANFLIFSLLIDFIHREGSIGQQARDALLLCMTLSSEEERVSKYIISTNFCPVLATGLSGLYSSLPRQMDVRADEWHFLRKQDWNHVPSLVNFMNSLEFCNSVVEAAGPIVVENLLNYIYNGFLVSVFGPALHKSSTNEVIVTTAYLNLFLQSLSAPPLMECFMRFLLCHRHDNSLIVNTLIQRIGSNSRLALVSLSLFRTLIDLNCEDLMLHLVFRYLIPCHHLLASQRRSVCDTDMYSASALRFIGLTESIQFRKSNKEEMKDPGDSNSLIQEKLKEEMKDENETTELQTNDNNTAASSGLEDANDSNDCTLPIVKSPNTIVEYGPDLKSQVALHTSYMDYLEDAKNGIDSCREACDSWSEPYDGENPHVDSILDPTVLNKNVSIYASSPALSTEPDLEFLNKKPYALSDPNPPAVSTNQQISSSALSALDATYQAMNIVSKALSTKPIENVPTPSPGVHFSSSVDEFFRTLMDSVPVNARERVEISLRKKSEEIDENRNVSSETQLEVNGENGIVGDGNGIVGDGNGIVGDRNGIVGDEDGNVDARKEQEQENGSQLSSSLNDEDSDSNECDDSTSINSSSFYEHELEYLPNDQSLPPLTPLKIQSAPYTGPFLSTLFGKLDHMPTNSLYENLLLTGIISRLACYPQPLLRSFLLNTRMVFHPAVRSLYQVLTGVKSHIDYYSSGIKDFDILLSRAQKYLLSRCVDGLPVEEITVNSIENTPMPVPRVKTKNTLIGEAFLKRKKRKSRLPKLETLLERRGKDSSLSRPPERLKERLYGAPQESGVNGLGQDKSKDGRTNNTVYSAIVLNEFLKELAAISQEHAVAC